MCVNKKVLLVLKSLLKRHLPLVCFIAVENSSDFKKVEDIFKKKIQEYED